MVIRARGAKLTTFKILFYLYFREGASVKEIMEDLMKLGLHPYTVKNSLSRLKKLGLLVHENKRYNLSKDLRSELDEIVKTTASRKMKQVNPNEVIP